MAEEKVRIKLFKDNGRYKSDLRSAAAWRWRCPGRWPRCWSTASARTI